MVSFATVSPSLTGCTIADSVAARVSGVFGTGCSKSRAASDCPRRESRYSREPIRSRNTPAATRMIESNVCNLARMDGSEEKDPPSGAAVLAKTATQRADQMRYRLRRSEKPAPESAPPLSSIISQPADVFGMERLAELLSFVLAVVAGGIVD